MADYSPPPLTIYLSLTSSPSTPRSTLTIPPPTSTFTAAQLRKEAAKITTVPLDKLKLIFRGRVISISNKDLVGNNINVVEEYKLENECVVHVMGKPVAGSGVSATSGAATSTASAATSATAAGARVTLPSSGTTANAAATARSSGSATTPIAAALDKLRSSNDGPTYRTALTTADKLLGNVVAHPMEEKYRTIKKSNPAFTKRLGGLPGGNDLMLASGFTIETRDADSIEYYVLTPSAHAWPTLVASREEIGRVLSESNRTTAAAVPGAAVPGAHSMPGMGGMPNFIPPGATNAASGGFGGSGGAGGGGMPDMAAVQNMLSDPTMMQNVMGMMNNPMVQNMMQNDPRFANNPMLQQSLQALQSNPEMMNQMASMMSDPAARERMASMMGGMGGNSGTAGGGAGAADAFAGGPDAMRRQMEQFQQMSQQFGGSSGGFNTGGAGGGSSGTAAPAAGSGTNNNASSNGSNTGGNDSDMTEEEMIAEAIRRSMEQS